jgi:hypothetical protein
MFSYQGKIEIFKKIIFSVFYLKKKKKKNLNFVPRGFFDRNFKASIKRFLRNLKHFLKSFFMFVKKL